MKAWLSSIGSGVAGNAHNSSPGRETEARVKWFNPEKAAITGYAQGQSPSSVRAVVDTPVHAHSIQAKSLFSERRGCSSDTGVRTLSACGGQGEKAAADRYGISPNNSRVGLGATIPQGRRS